MNETQESLERRLQIWREKLALVTRALEQMPRYESPLTGGRTFFYREKYACTCVIAELEQVSEEMHLK